MVDYKVFIPTSGIGSRLGELTTYTNKALIRVGRKPSISYIIESYPKDTKFVISLGHHGQQVKDFLLMAYKDREFEFVEIDKYDSEDASLLYSISKAKNVLKCPFIFHACDTIIEKIDITFDNNTLIGHKPTYNPEYRSFNVSNSLVSTINDKGDLKYDYDYVGVFLIKDFNIFWSSVDSLLKEKFIGSDYDIIKEMLQKEALFNYKVTSDWLDIGNVSALQHARKNIEDKFDILDKSDESIFLFDDFVIKFFYNKSICRNRVERASQLSDLTPRILESTDNFYKYEFVEGELLSKEANPDSFLTFLEWSKNNLWLETTKPDNFFDICHNFYFKKTETRIHNFLKKNNILDKEECINGITIPKTFDLLKNLDKQEFCDVKSYKFHGDCILDNILVKEGGFCLIDWRQDFGGDLEHGDIYYDLGKLNHNLIFNHELINKNNFLIKENKNNITCDLLVSKTLLDCKKQLEAFCNKNNYNYKKVEIMSALIWLNMASLHLHPLDRFLYYFGKYNLFLNMRNEND